MPNFPGVDFKIGDTTYVIPALSLGQLRNGALKLLQEHDALLAEGKTYEAITLRAKLILAALQRNYPDFSEDLLLEHLDIRNNSPIWLSILGASGFTPGETQAAATTAEPGTSSLSTAA